MPFETLPLLRSGHGRRALGLIALTCMLVALAVLVGPRTTTLDSGRPLIIEFTERGRVQLDFEVIPRGGTIELLLALTESDSDPGPRGVRIVGVDGRLFETTGHPVEREPSALRAEIDGDFLVRGSYLVEVDTAERHPLHLRRYVLEIR